MGDSELEDGELIETFENSSAQTEQTKEAPQLKSKRPRAEENKQRKGKCKYWPTGNCHRGQDCPYLHEGNSESHELKKFANKFFYPQAAPMIPLVRENYLFGMPEVYNQYMGNSMSPLLPYPNTMLAHSMWMVPPPPRPPSPDLSSRLHACGIIKAKNIPMPSPELIRSKSIPDRKQIFKTL